jgi:hypothetical protein
MQEEAMADELVLVTPSLERARRHASFRAIAAAWG